jgi:DNA mismatch repair protein MutS2
MKGQDTPGEVLDLKGNKATVAFGEIRTFVNLNVIEKISEEKYKSGTRPKTSSPAQNQWSIGKKRLTFSPDIDVRGKRADEAIQVITEFIDDAVMLQNHDLRILHGKGNGILREMIRQYLGGLDVVESFKDEHVERGGAGITVVKLDF